MKKLLLIATLCLTCGTLATGQTRAFVNPSNTDERTDTVSNSTTMYLKATANASPTMGVQLIGTWVSGTIAATAYLEASLDNTEAVYSVIDSLVFATQTSAGSQQILRKYADNPYTKWRWRIVPAGTQKFIVRGLYNKLL